MTSIIMCCIFLLYLNCENFMKLLNYYGDVVGGYICVCTYMLLVNFLTCYWRRFEGVSMYSNMLVNYICISTYMLIGEFSYMLLATIWWCKHVLKYVGVEFGVDCVICTCIYYWWWRIIYPYWRQLWCVCCIMRWRPQRWFGTTCIWVSCLGALHKVDMCHKCLSTWWMFVIGESFTCWELLIEDSGSFLCFSVRVLD